MNTDTGRWVHVHSLGRETGREVQGIGRRALKQTVPDMLTKEIALAVAMDAGRCGLRGKKASKGKRQRWPGAECVKAVHGESM